MCKNACDNIATTFQNKCQHTVNNFWSCILDNQRAMQPGQPIIEVSAAFMGKNAADDIASTS